METSVTANVITPLNISATDPSGSNLPAKMQRATKHEDHGSKCPYSEGEGDAYWQPIGGNEVAMNGVTGGDPGKRTGYQSRKVARKSNEHCEEVTTGGRPQHKPASNPAETKGQRRSNDIERRVQNVESDEMRIVTLILIRIQCVQQKARCHAGCQTRGQEDRNHLGDQHIRSRCRELLLLLRA